MTGADHPGPATTGAKHGRFAASRGERKQQLLQHIHERIAEATKAFAENRDSAYRDNLQKIQVDFNLIQRFDPHAPDALGRIASLRREQRALNGGIVPSPKGMTLLDMAGPTFQEYLDSVEDNTEERDAALAAHKKSADERLARIKSTYRFKVNTAVNEYENLKKTVSDRLYNGISARKNRLNKEKEALEISEASVLLLHPNQFSLGNPTSPGGTIVKRATRTRREADDAASIVDGKKRKRNPTDDDGSPVPTRRALDPNHTTPLWQSERIRAPPKTPEPVYSINTLFTEREQLMIHFNAALDAHKQMIKHTSHASDSSSADSESGNGADDGEQDAEPAAAPAMERQVSHATRSTRGGGGGGGGGVGSGGSGGGNNDDRAAASDGAGNSDVAYLIKQVFSFDAPRMPPPGSCHYLKSTPRLGESHLLTPLSADEASKDLLVISALKQRVASRKPGACLDEPNGLRELAEIVSKSAADADRAWKPRSGAIFVDRFEDGPDDVAPASSAPARPLVPVAAAIPMSRQSSVGPVAMSRQSSARGKGRKH